MTFINPHLFNNYTLNNCYFSCKTNDNGKSYLCKKVNSLEEASCNNAVVIRTTCACPAYLQTMKLIRKLDTSNITIR